MRPVVVHATHVHAPHDLAVGAFVRAIFVRLACAIRRQTWDKMEDKTNFKGVV